ncbi:MAG: hypothetical protein OHK0028_16200 [Deltaproteobacteria bacterium]
MPTSHNVTPRRVLSLILTIPLLLLFLAVRPIGPVPASGDSSCAGPGGLSHRLPIPVPWEDDVLATGLPIAPHPGKRTVRKLVPANVHCVERPGPAARGFRPGPRSARFSPTHALSVSLLLSRPPPAAPPPEGYGGRGGNDDIPHSMV